MGGKTTTTGLKQKIRRRIQVYIGDEKAGMPCEQQQQQKKTLKDKRHIRG